MNLFTAEINGWSSWGKVFQSISTFKPLIRHIFAEENLPLSKIERCTPGTHAVFRVGDYVIKIFAPEESGFDGTVDFETEVFAMQRATMLGVSVPKLMTCGALQVQYRFSYLIMEYKSGIEFNKLSPTLTFEQKVAIGQRLRVITNTLNQPCDAFNQIDVIHGENRQQRWEKYAERFKRERLDYISSHDFGEKVFVHGDLNGDNILLSPEKELTIIDFADAVLAPAVYEQALIVCELFQFNKAYMQGYFGDYTVDAITDLCFNGLLIHDFGGDIIEQRVGPVDQINSLEALHRCLYLCIKYTQTFKGPYEA
ncbi:serine/threonine protein kinase [Pullulanibacillus pueri]|uniref:Aminoglycoside phosphotransferase domain-containing protein n=1 Tax=Pullulanibacillus pueri TaxID=1437324 RepID=A0A8J2ZUJ9_9BACL|nr:aminoglycoside phosphotransferase family protein [Pullulanibacillus pueri]MBM7681152.1 serine/threonine protein kinase [Pullulanibacillus pueri]GGH77249.1 hypothetical protein GCM10007096_08870 [Pullulanibacillus pueri]